MGLGGGGTGELEGQDDSHGLRPVPSPGQAEIGQLLDDADPFGDVHGAGYRAVYDLADLDASLFQMSLGQSGHRLSPHFSDLARAWADGTPFRIGASPERPTATLMLRPH